MKHTVNSVVRDNLCISCGLCASVCHKKAITYNLSNGMYYPIINNENCVDCGICFDICPGKGCEYKRNYNYLNTPFPEDLWIGNFKEAFTMSSKNIQLLQNSTSGGVVTSIVEYLLNKDIYDGAFLVGTYSYDCAVNTKLYKKGDDLSCTSKSRYIPVMHTNAIEYILKHRDERIILVGVPCFVQGFINTIIKYGLKRDNYFIIGLFCDRTMNYNIYSYFERFCAPKRLKNLYFRDKSQSGWPGDVLLECEDNSLIHLPRNKRTAVKEYFTPERCLYCLDKFNQFADVSVGDNYTGKDELQFGSNSVVVRTEIGNKHFNDAINDGVFDAFAASVNDIAISQKIINRYDNLENQCLKESECLIKNTEFDAYKQKCNKNQYIKLLRKSYLGATFDYDAIDEEVCKLKKRKNGLGLKLLHLLSRVKCKIFKVT